MRVIAATHRNLRNMVNEQRFREDLYYRLSMIDIHLPTLSERKEDLPLLQELFVEKFSAQYQKPISGISRRAQIVLARHDWPGNVRELENVLGNACMLTEGPAVDVKDLPASLRVGSGVTQNRESNLLSMEEVQQRHLFQVLERVGGDKVRAAEVLGIARATVYNMLARMEAKQQAY